MTKLIGKEIEVQRLSEYNKMLELERRQLADNDDPSLENPLASEITGISSLIIGNLTDAGYDTPRKLLMASIEELLNVPGLNSNTADAILEQIRKKRM